MQTPLWALRILIEEQPAVEAQRLQELIRATSFPYLKRDEDRRALTRDLADLTAPASRRGPDIGALIAAGDLDAAAAAITALGISVRRAETA